MVDEFLIPDEPVKQYFQKRDVPEIVLVRNNTPIFGYNFLSMNNTVECFNHQQLKHKEFAAYFQKVKQMSGLTIQQLLDDKKDYHFHEIKGDALNNIIYKIKRHLDMPGNCSLDELPIIGQFALYTDDEVYENGRLVSKAPRVIFALSGSGLFNILFLDVNHKIYPKEIQTPALLTKQVHKITKGIKNVKGLSKMLKENLKKQTTNKK